jgi:hypothetical protein
MARIEWTRHSGEDVETVVAILLCREFTNAVRIKPSRGDGGIDILVQRPNDSTVYQVKKFAENLTANQKTQVTKSWNRFLHYKKNLKNPVSDWHVVMPVNPSKEQLAWVDEFTQGSGLFCTWLGIDYIEGLVTKFPEVVDYYFDNGRERVDETVSRYLSILHAVNPVPSPGESVQTLTDIHKALNDNDPHFRYDYSVTGVGPDGKGPDITQEQGPGLVGVAQTNNGEQCVTFRIFTKFDAALDYRPVPGKFTIQAEKGTEQAAALEDWINFGTPLKDMPAVDVHVGFPGGLGTTTPQALMTIGPSKSAGPLVELTIKTIAPDGSTVATLDFLTDEVTTGLDKQRLRAVGSDARLGIVHYEMRISKTDSTHVVNIQIDGIVGYPPAELLPILQFLGSVSPPNQMQLFRRNGPAFGPWTSVPSALIDPQRSLFATNICENLATIQQHTFFKILFPDLTGVPYETFLDWSDAATLLKGEVMKGTWTEVCFHLKPGATLSDAPQAMAIPRELNVTVGGTTYGLGSTITHIESVRPDPSRPPEQHDDHLDVWVIPAESDRVTIRRVADQSSPLPLS